MTIAEGFGISEEDDVKSMPNRSGKSETSMLMTTLTVRETVYLLSLTSAADFHFKIINDNPLAIGVWTCSISKWSSDYED